MSRDSKIRALSRALHPKTQDLASMRQRSIHEREVKLKPEDAAGMIAFAANDTLDADGMVMRGDPLPGLLLQLKYAQQRTPDRYKQAHAILVGRHGGLDRRRNRTVSAIGMAALVEWVNDLCPKCRGGKAGATQPRTCACLKREVEDRLCLPRPGCPQCGGLGRIFKKPERARGVRCLSCNSTGRHSLSVKRRWLAVSTLSRIAEEEVGRPAQSLTIDNFRGHWHPRYLRFIEVLNAIDKRVVDGLDFWYVASQNRGIDIEPQEEEDHIGPNEPAVGSGSPTVDEPQ
jgi:hypothetical protein